MRWGSKSTEPRRHIPAIIPIGPITLVPIVPVTRTHQNQPPKALRKLVGFGGFWWVLVGIGWQVPKKVKKMPSFSASPGMFPNLNQPPSAIAQRTGGNAQNFTVEN